MSAEQHFSKLSLPKSFLPLFVEKFSLTLTEVGLITGIS